MLAQRAPRLAKLDKATRSHAMWLAANWEGSERGPGAELWHAELPDHVRRLINHPATVHRRYDKDWPAPPKYQARSDLYEADENDEEDEEGEEDEGRFAPGEGEGSGGEDDVGYTRESWLAAVRELWEAGETAWRDEFLDAETAMREVAAFDEAEAELTASVEREAALEVNAEARETDRVRLSGEPSDERIGVAVLNAAEEIRAVRAGEKAAEPVVFPDDELGASPTEHMTKAEFDERLRVEEARLGKDVVAGVRRAHRNGRYRIDWAPILDELAAKAAP
jgi:hypothetical protein